jgi:hypothetical protein
VGRRGQGLSAADGEEDAVGAEAEAYAIDGLALGPGGAVRLASRRVSIGDTVRDQLLSGPTVSVQCLLPGQSDPLSSPTCVLTTQTASYLCFLSFWPFSSQAVQILASSLVAPILASSLIATHPLSYFSQGVAA